MQPLKLEVRLMYAHSNNNFQFRFFSNEIIIHAYAQFNQDGERIRIPGDFIKVHYEEDQCRDVDRLRRIYYDIGAEFEEYFDAVYQKTDETDLCLDQTGIVDDYLFRVGITFKIKDYAYVKAKDQKRPTSFQRSR